MARKLEDIFDFKPDPYTIEPERPYAKVCSECEFFVRKVGGTVTCTNIVKAMVLDMALKTTRYREEMERHGNINILAEEEMDLICKLWTPKEL